MHDVLKLLICIVNITLAILLEICSLAQPDPLPNATWRKWSGDIAYNDLCRFTNILVKTTGI